ncbi:hypothetical protein ACUH9O_03235 [Dermabacteraceae bacterium P13103]
MSSTKKVYIFPQSPMRLFCGITGILLILNIPDLFLQFCKAQKNQYLCGEGMLNSLKIFDIYTKVMGDNNFFSTAFSVLLSLLIVSAFTRLDSIPEWHKLLLIFTGPLAVTLLITQGLKDFPKAEKLALLLLVPFIYITYESAVKSLAWRNNNVGLAYEQTKDRLAECERHDSQIKRLPHNKRPILATALLLAAIVPILILAITKAWLPTLKLFTFIFLSQPFLTFIIWLLAVCSFTEPLNYYLWTSTSLSNSFSLKDPKKRGPSIFYFMVEAIYVSLVLFAIYHFWVEICLPQIIVMLASAFILNHWSPSHGISYLWIVRCINCTFRKSEVGRLNKQSRELEDYLKESK